MAGRGSLRSSTCTQLFFIYDHTTLKKEEDDLKDAIVYFSPPTVSVEDQCALCGQLMGLVKFFSSICGGDPQIYRLARDKYVLRHVEDRYTLALGSSGSTPDSILQQQLSLLFETFTMFKGSLQSVRTACDDSGQSFAEELELIWECYLPFCASFGDGVRRGFNSIPAINLPKSGADIFLQASNMLQASVRRPAVLAGAILSSNSILCTQLSEDMTTKLMVIKPQQSHLPCIPVSTDFQLPKGVRIVNVFIHCEEYSRLKHRSRRPKQTHTRVSRFKQCSTSNTSQGPPSYSAVSQDLSDSETIRGHHVVEHTHEHSQLDSSQQGWNSEIMESDRLWSLGIKDNREEATVKEADINTVPKKAVSPSLSENGRIVNCGDQSSAATWDVRLEDQDASQHADNSDDTADDTDHVTRCQVVEADIHIPRQNLSKFPQGSNDMDILSSEDVQEKQSYNTLAGRVNMSQISTPDVLDTSSHSHTPDIIDVVQTPDIIDVPHTPDVLDVSKSPTPDVVQLHLSHNKASADKSDGQVSHNPRSDGEMSHNPRSDGEMSHNPRSGGEMSHNPRSGGEMSHNPRSEGEMSHNPRSEGEMSHNPRSDGEMSHNPRSDGEMSHNPRSDGEMSHNPRSGGEMSHNPRSEGEMSHNPRSDGEMSHNPRSGGEMSHNPRSEGEMSHNPTSPEDASHNFISNVSQNSIFDDFSQNLTSNSADLSPEKSEASVSRNSILDSSCSPSMNKAVLNNQNDVLKSDGVKVSEENSELNPSESQSVSESELSKFESFARLPEVESELETKLESLTITRCFNHNDQSQVTTCTGSSDDNQVIIEENMSESPIIGERAASALSGNDLTNSSWENTSLQHVGQEKFEFSEHSGDKQLISDSSAERQASEERNINSLPVQPRNLPPLPRASNQETGHHPCTGDLDDYENLTLYIQGHSESVLVLLMEHEARYDRSTIQALWKLALPQLGDLDFRVKEFLDMESPKPANDGYNYLKFNEFQRQLTGNVMKPVTSGECDFCDLSLDFHEEFKKSPTLTEATARSHTASVYAHRSVNHEIYFQLHGRPRHSSGLPVPNDVVFTMDQTSRRKLYKNHSITFV